MVMLGLLAYRTDGFVGSITSRCPGKETKHERAAEIEPSGFVEFFNCLLKYKRPVHVIGRLVGQQDSYISHTWHLMI